jgi:hypothetical protein
MSGRGRGGRGRGSGDVRNVDLIMPDRLHTNTSNNVYKDLETLTADIMATQQLNLISKFIKLLEKYKSPPPQLVPRRVESSGRNTSRSLAIQYENIKKLVFKLGTVWTHKLEAEYKKEYGTEINMGDMSMSVLIRNTRGVHAVQSVKNMNKHFVVPNGPLVDEPELDDTSGDESSSEEEPTPDNNDDNDDDDDGWTTNDAVLADIINDANTAHEPILQDSVSAARGPILQDIVVIDAPDPE